MNGFEIHNIKHSSPSALNMWIDAPHMWVAQYLFNKRGMFAPAAKCGTLVEKAVVNVISKGFMVEEAVRQANEEYNRFILFGCSDADKKRGEGIQGMIENAVDALKQYGEPEFDVDLFGEIQQKKIELRCIGDSWELPVIGYIDFHFPKHGVVVDLKTTMRMPDKLSDAHHRQACIYQKAFGNQSVKFLYVTPKKHSVFDCGDVQNRLLEIKIYLNRQERFLRLGEADLLKGIVPVISSSFYHDDAISGDLFN